MGFKQCGNNIVVKSSVGYAGDRHLQNNNGKNAGTKINSRTVGAASCGLAVQEAARAAAISGNSQLAWKTLIRHVVAKRDCLALLVKRCRQLMLRLMVK